MLGSDWSILTDLEYLLSAGDAGLRRRHWCCLVKDGGPGAGAADQSEASIIVDIDQSELTW